MTYKIDDEMQRVLDEHAEVSAEFFEIVRVALKWLGKGSAVCLEVRTDGRIRGNAFAAPADYDIANIERDWPMVKWDEGQG